MTVGHRYGGALPPQINNGKGNHASRNEPGDEPVIASAIKLAVFLIAGALRSVAGIDDPPAVLIPPATAVHCAEDDPCWDCATMGNQVCGTSTRGSGTF